jgi:FlaA1/EpsC-like NDP-sugar epimerase
MRNRIFLGLDLVATIAVAIFAFTARYEGFGWWLTLRPVVLAYITFAVPLKIAAFLSVGLYRRLWRYASIADLEVVFAASALGTIVAFAIGIWVLPALGIVEGRLSIGVLVVDSSLTAAAITIPRLLLRVFVRRSRSATQSNRRRTMRRASDENRRVLNVGAGAAGGMIAKELCDNPQLALEPIGFVDDDSTKHGHRLEGLPVFGAIADIESVVARHVVHEIVIALPSVGGKVIRDIVRSAARAGVHTRTVPGLYEILSGAKSVNALRSIQIEDLLRRDPVETNANEVSRLVTGQTVMVTGAGGSIGRELCHQLARLDPKRIVAVGRGENSIFELLEEFRTSHPGVLIQPAIVDVRDPIRMRAVFEEARPFSVFHAAAHKHVPLMESRVDEAILNNVLGTRNVAELSASYGVEHLVLISTDKAVRPTSIMGATKRIAEEILCGVAERAQKPYVSVRFGNVLGSRGSVVPTFMRQIAAGGPITITHPEMRRYFMTIPEAVQLVLQAAAMGRGGEVFALDMGEPVKIADLAEDLIRLSGLEVGSDIEIEFTGTRPGEKLYEELFFGPKDATPTSHPKVLRARDGRASLESEFNVNMLIEAAYRRVPEDELRRMIASLVPEYTGPAQAPKPAVARTTVLKPQPVAAQPPPSHLAPKPILLKARDRSGRPLQT